MKRNIAIFAAAMLFMSYGAAPVVAGGLVKGLVGGVKDTVSSVSDTVSSTVSGVTGGGGGSGSGGLLSLNDDNNDALLNVDLLNGDNQVLNAAVGSGSDPLLNANVSSSGLLSETTVSLSLGGLGLDLSVDLGVPGPGGPTPGAGSDGRILVGSLGGAGFVVTCAVNNARYLLQVAANGKISAAEIRAWQRFANVQIVPIKLCPPAKKQVGAILGKSQKINLLRRAVMSDNLIMASLSRTRYKATDVVAVERKSGQLVVYVY
jgi:hypothetical protein